MRQLARRPRQAVIQRGAGSTDARSRWNGRTRPAGVRSPAGAILTPASTHAPARVAASFPAPMLCWPQPHAASLAVHVRSARSSQRSFEGVGRRHCAVEATEGAPLKADFTYAQTKGAASLLPTFRPYHAGFTSLRRQPAGPRAPQDGSSLTCGPASSCGCVASVSEAAAFGAGSAYVPPRAATSLPSPMRAGYTSSCRWPDGPCALQGGPLLVCEPARSRHCATSASRVTTLGASSAHVRREM